MTKKLSRNSPCPCGSGHKYKKCCMPSKEKGLPEPDTAAERLGYPGDGRRGAAARIAEFAQPLLDAAGHDPKQMTKALQFGMLFWNVAITAEAAGEETARKQLAEIESGLCNSAEDCRALRGMARTLFERNARMLPGAKVNMLHLIEDLWGADLSESMPKFGWCHRITRTAKRWLARETSYAESKF